MPQPGDPRLREVTYDARAVVTVPVKRGVVTHVVLDADESITEVGRGLGGDCAKAEAVWCIAAQPGGRNLFVKPKSRRGAREQPGRRHRPAHALVPLRRAGRRRCEAAGVSARRQGAEADASREPRCATAALLPALPVAAAGARHRRARSSVVAERLQAKPQVLNTGYSIAEGKGSEDIVPTLVFDDGRFTYFRFPGNREVPAVFHVLGDGSETLVNTRMEDDLLVVDRVSRRLMLRAGSAVVGVWNEAFDLDGVPPAGGTTVPGVQRALKAEPAAADRRRDGLRSEEQRHERDDRKPAATDGRRRGQRDRAAARRSGHPERRASAQRIRSRRRACSRSAC